MGGAVVALTATLNLSDGTAVTHTGLQALTDTGKADALTEGIGADTLAGRGGADRLSGAANEGTDAVSIAGRSSTLPDHVENLFLTAGPVHGTGKAAANVPNGSASANILRGLAGNDTLRGNGGNDTLFGGTPPTRCTEAVGATCCTVARGPIVSSSPRSGTAHPARPGRTALPISTARKGTG